MNDIMQQEMEANPPANQCGSSPHTPTEKAIMLLQDTMDDVLSGNCMVLAFNLLMDLVKAGAFAVMKPQYRLQWVLNSV